MNGKVLRAQQEEAMSDAMSDAANRVAWTKAHV